MDRRQALRRLGTGLLGLCGCAGLPTYLATLEAGTIELRRDEVESGFGAGNAVRIRASGLEEEIALLRLGDGSLRALGTTCTHLGCQVRPGGEFLVCPCHGSTFDRQGAVVRGPAQRPLTSYPVAVSEDRITIHTSAS